MATIKSCTDLEQSKKLAEFLSIESADMYIYKNVFFGALSCFNGTTQIGEYIKLTDKESKAYPCWSLAALRNLLPSAIKSNKDSYLFESHNTFDNSWVYRYYNEDDTSYLYCKNANEVDACYDLIIKLYEKDLL